MLMGGWSLWVCLETNKTSVVSDDRKERSGEKCADGTLRVRMGVCGLSQ